MRRCRMGCGSGAAVFFKHPAHSLSLTDDQAAHFGVVEQQIHVYLMTNKERSSSHLGVHVQLVVVHGLQLADGALHRARVAHRLNHVASARLALR